jgi:hypothetical protein
MIGHIPQAHNCIPDLPDFSIPVYFALNDGFLIGKTFVLISELTSPPVHLNT